MAEFVVDTNVWAMADKLIADANEIELDCIEAAQNWLRAFIAGTDILALDDRYQILGEYRANIRQRGFATQILNQLEKKPRDRLIEVTIEFDDDGYAILSEEVLIDDKSDRKFIAVSLKFDPPAPLINAVDTDWTKDKPKLDAAKILVQELCPDYIAAKLK